MKDTETLPAFYSELFGLSADDVWIQTLLIFS